jgi:hypothetical protein
MIINTRTITDPNFSKEFPSYKKNTPKYLQTLKIICNPPLNKSQIISEMCIAEYSNQNHGCSYNVSYIILSDPSFMRPEMIIAAQIPI